ncbi:MAG TPA: hypothetical protein VGX72_14925 [Solirubrobacteraceae bacterium]|jgi:hypothetical protein|nr:hypothetical protein [Solirubrobacteraceae bacterium]
MRRVRVVLGFAAVICAFGALTAPAFARERKPAIFGKFTASINGKTISPGEPAATKGHGEVEAMKLGPYVFTGRNLGEGKHGPVCERALKSQGEVASESSETVVQNITFSKCVSTRRAGSSEEAVVFHFTLGMEFHSNGSAVAGESEATEVKIIKGSTVHFKGSKSTCEVIIPEQTVPVKAATKPEKEYESAAYETEEEEVEGKKALKEFPSGFQQKLDITMEFKKLHTIEQLNPAKGCTNGKLEEGGTFNKEHDTVEYANGILEAELEEIEIKGGNVGFVPAV